MARLASRDVVWGYGFIAPWLIGLLLFTAGPIVAVFYWSFTDYPILSAPTWVGLKNYEKILTGDPLFWKSIQNTAYYVGLRVPLHLLLAFGLALLINRSIRGISFLRTAIYLPSVVPIVALAVIWRLLLDPRGGYLNYYGSLVGLPATNFLTSEALVKPAIIGISLFQVGIAMVIFMAGLQAIPEQLYEAAAIDGANAWQRLVTVTVPMLTPVILYNLIVDIINSFQVFAYAFILTGGAPANAALFYVLYIYKQAFEFFQMGYASALSVILFLVILVFTALLMSFSDRWVQYDRI
jgi:multiple sugar transport system permease protein